MQKQRGENVDLEPPRGGGKGEERRKEESNI